MAALKMKRAYLLVLLVQTLLLNCSLAYKSYDGYQVLETSVLDLAGVRMLLPLSEWPGVDFWLEPRVGRPARIMVSPQVANEMQDTLRVMGFSTLVRIPDVGITVKKERAEQEALQRQANLEGRAPALDRYLTFEEIQAYLDEVAAIYPEIATIIDIGTSFEGRPMRILKLSNGPNKTAIFVDSGIHAREWIGPPTVLYSINELTENLAINQAILDANDFYFLPVFNPDGYSYTHSTDRFWRKTRRPNPGSSCVGTDPNRNFDQNWAGGGMPSPCSETFPGSAPWSESEVKAMADFVAANPSITFGLSVHSCGKFLLYPYGDTLELPPNVAELDRVGSEALAALEAVNGTVYQLGSIANTLYLAYGSSTDWNYVQQNMLLAYTIELPCGGSGGFDPPPSAIGPVTVETWEAYKVLFANIPPSRG